MNSNIHIKDHMKSLGLSSSSKMDKYLYATMLQTLSVSAPMALRGSRKDPETGFLWKRVDEFIIKQRYGVHMGGIAKLLYDACKQYDVSSDASVVVKVNISGGDVFFVSFSNKCIKIISKYLVDSFLNR